MPKSKKVGKKDDRMIADYFKHLTNYINKYGKKTILLWQCGSFYEVYSTQDPNTKEFLYQQFNDFLNITHLRDANKNLTYKENDIRHLIIFYKNILQF